MSGLVCAACGAGNREGRRFCAQCGAALAPACPACGARNETGERFCGDCGAALVEPGPAPAQPAPVAEDAPGRPPLEGERKQVTVLFADVSGSMDLAEQLGADEWASVMDRFFSLLAEAVLRFEGTVDKFTGDGIMALFGAPVAYEDHARRACHAALALTGAAAAYAEELRRTKSLNLHVRVGLNSGEVVVGRIGDQGSMEYTALGHTVGLAQRMETLAEPGVAYLTEHTARLVSGQFRLRDLGAFAVKGSSEPVGVFALEGAGPRRRPGGVARWPGRSPLVGRDEEMAALEAALARALAGQAQVVGVVGEPGVGKSRLCEEFTRSPSARGIAVRGAAGVSHARGVPLLPILELLRDYFGITDTEAPGIAREKVAGRLLLLDPAFADALPLLFDFLEIPDPQRPPPRLSGEVRRRRVFEVLRRLTQRRSEREPSVLLMEDLHWFDPESAAFLEELISSYPGTRTLVLANFRPEFTAAWMRQSYYRQLPLAPLPPEAVEDLLAALMGRDSSLAPLFAPVIERTGGNPFFVEEVIRSLVEDGTLLGEPGAYQLARTPGEVRVPPTVQATLSARIDRLAERDKQVLQTASVIGRTFAEAVLAAVAGRADEDLASALSALCAAEFLVEETPWPAAEYRFWHPLTQEVAYGSLLSERRARLHAGVARALAEADPARQDERAALIATHYERAGDGLEAARWEERAGTWAWRRDLAEAVRRWRATLAHLDGLPETEDALRIGILARRQLVRIGARAGLPPDETQALHREARELAERLDDHDLLTMVSFAHAPDPLLRGELAEGRDAFLEAARLGALSRDPGLRAITALGPVLVGGYVGPLEEGLRFADRAESICAGDLEAGTRYLGYSPLVAMFHYRARLLALAGRVPDARADAERALSLARERGDVETLGFAQSTFARLADLSGEDHDAAARAAEAVRIGEDSGNVWVHVTALQARGIASLIGGQHKEATEDFMRGLAEARERHSGLCEEASLLAHLARARLGLGDADGARAAADEAVEVARRQGARVVECFALLVRARVCRETGGPDDLAAARADLDDAAVLAAETGAVTYEVMIAEERAGLHNDPAALAEVARRYEAIGATSHARRLVAN